MIIVALIAFVALPTTWCFYRAVASLLPSCSGDDKASSVEPGGRTRSVLLVFFAIVLSLLFQRGIAPHVIYLDSLGNFYIEDAWSDGCDDLETNALIEQCA
eukprot:Nitzschia sp. Nitz4//scaffold702_size1622//946//1430//NITZ4_009319-RA/size1622-exonerate_est2genome-gene-0.0-mRNA-1//1//CDS//3329557073//5891//frame0